MNKLSQAVTTPTADNELLCEASDSVDNAAFGLLSAISAQNLEWDMSIIAELTDAAEEILARRSVPVCRPWEDEDGNICYSLENDRCKHCSRSKKR